MKMSAISFLTLLLFILAQPRTAWSQANDAPAILPVFSGEMSHPDLDAFRVSSFELKLAPAFRNEAGHRHGGDLFGYVLQGSIELVIEGRDTLVFGEGEMFHERHLELHRTYRNPSLTDTTRVLMLQVVGKDERGFVPEEDSH